MIFTIKGIDKSQLIVYYIYIMLKLLDAIKDYQFYHHLNDCQFSDLIKVDPSTFSKVKSQKRHPGRRFLEALMQIPELKLAVFQYMSAAKE